MPVADWVAMRVILLACAAVVLLGCPRERLSTAPSQPPTRIGDGDVGDAFELGGEPAPIDAEKCNAAAVASERRGGDLIVHAPPDRPSNPAFVGRLRTHIEGALSRGSRRTWVGPHVPGFVPLTEGTQELFLLEPAGDDVLAFYRDPYGASTCDLSGNGNCGYTVRLLGRCGETKWSLRLDELMSRSTMLEVQDLRFVDGVLYFNEACQGYSSQAGGKCSSLVAVDPASGSVLWRSQPLVSNSRFIVHGDYIVSGYGFTSERDHLFVVRRSDGKVMQKLAVGSAPEDIRLVGSDIVEVVLYSGKRPRFRLRGWDGPQPRIAP